MKKKKPDNRHTPNLRLQLTLRFAGATVAALFVLILLLSLFLFSRILVNNWRLSPEEWVRIAERTAVSTTRAILETDSHNRGLVSLWLRMVGSPTSYHRLLKVGDVDITMRMTRSVSALLLDNRGYVLGFTGGEGSSENFPGQPFDGTMFPEFAPPVLYALRGGTDPAQLVRPHSSGDGFVLASPIYSETGNTFLGVISVHFGDLPSGADVAGHTLRSVSAAAAIILILAGSVAVVFGYFTSRGLTSRLRRFAVVADRWSRGDYSGFIQDNRDDEIGNLADRFNTMAEQTADLLRRRREVAIAEERQRMARDLHDSVKQQALAASMQIGTALAMEKEGPAAIHLREAENLLDSLRVELTALVDALYLPECTEDFPSYLRFYIDRWADRNTIAAETIIDMHSVIPESVAGNLYHILQEALSNVARHSGASMVRVHLGFSGKTCELEVRDNGRGCGDERECTGMGLRGMRERAEAAGGTMTLETTLAGGTTVKVAIPVED